jgi:pSer/pThr/pTyr-binding forkhead associated (FHA) protein
VSTDDDDGHHLPPHRATRVRAMLVVCGGPTVGVASQSRRTSQTWGRHPSCDIVLDHITVTSRHARLQRTPAGFRIADLGSLNGIYVNQERVSAAAVDPSDEIQIRKFRLRLQVGPSEAAIPLD